MSGAKEIRAQALEVAAGWSTPDAPASWQLTAALFRVIAGHHALLEGLAALPAERLPALLCSAAITFLVRREHPQPLAGYFPLAGHPQPPLDSGFEAAAADFVTGRMDQIVAVCRDHRYQMNEVARCAQIAAGIATTAPDGPVALVDLGTGAGLGLQLDRYRYDLGGRLTGPADAAVTLRCQVRGAKAVPPAILPPIAERAGIELAPVDLGDPDALAWLQACAPPEAAALTRLTAAAVARAHPARIVAGDIVAELPGVLDSFPADLPVLVVDAYVAVFLPGPALRTVTAILRRAGLSRPVTWLSLDPLIPLGPAGRDSVQGLAVPDGIAADYQQLGVFAVLGSRTFAGSAEDGRLLARAHPSGHWIEWLA